MIFPQVHVKRLLHPLYQGVRDFYDKMTNGCSSSNHLSLTVSCQTEPRRFVLGSTWLRGSIWQSRNESNTAYSRGRIGGSDPLGHVLGLHYHRSHLHIDRPPSKSSQKGFVLRAYVRRPRFAQSRKRPSTYNNTMIMTTNNTICCAVFLPFLIIITRNNSTNIVKPDHQSQTNKKVFIHRPPETPPLCSADQQNNKTSNNNEQQR